MRSWSLSHRAALLLCLNFDRTLAIGTNNQVNANIDYGTFENPSSNVRPRFRYWVNDASMSLSRVAEDVRSLAKAGAGGLELLGYYLYGNTYSYLGFNQGIVQSDWTVYGYGGEPWKDLQDTVLETAQDEGLLVDLTIGPNQGAGIPAEYGDDGLLWFLGAFNETVSKGTSSIASIPGWGGRYNEDSLIGAVTALVVAENGTQKTLAASSLQDVTSLVNGADGSLSLNFNATDEGTEYVLFAFYQEHADYRAVVAPDETEVAVPQSLVENYKQNGSWVVDHFSAAGAQVFIDFWNSSLLYGNSSDTLRNVGNFLWEDSQEFHLQTANSNLMWTPKLAEVFLSNRGYSIINYLPFIVSADLAQVTAFTTNVTYVSDEEDGGQSYTEDYQQTLTELNAEYLNALVAWSNSLGIQFSSQVVYNLPMDMLANIPLVDGPECETFGLSHNIDAYRQFAGPANLAGKRIISSEAGAVYGLVYQQSIPDLLWDLRRSFAGGVNQFILHGYPFSGNYGNTTWPGFVTFNYAFSEMYGPRQPAHEFSGEWLNWTGRTQYVLQSGVPKVDLAFWSKLTSYELVTTQYEPTDLLGAGFTYEYLSPDNLDLPEAYVANGTFAPERQAFKALIVRANASLTLSGVSHLIDYANEGLPLIFSGGLPTKISGHDQAGGENLTATLETLTDLDNVHVVPYEGLADSLLSLGITPRAAVSANGPLYTYWRDDANASTQYVFVYNDATDSPLGQGTIVGNISFETTGKPFLFDAWTGKKTALSAYQQSGTSTTVQLYLAGNQSVILAFETGDPSSDVSLHIESGVSPSSASGAVLSTNSEDSGSLVYLATYSTEAQTILLSDGTSTAIQPMPAPASTLTNWTLTIESWGPPADLYDAEAGPTKTNSTTPYSLTTLQPWSNISAALTNVSGLGYYHTTFDWSSSADNSTVVVSGAFLDLGAIIHTARLSINGQVVPPLDHAWARADIGAYLVEGTNVVDVVVSTPLGNGLRGIWGELVTSGRPAADIVPEPPEVMEYGLVGEVRLIPYRRDVLS